MNDYSLNPYSSASVGLNPYSSTSLMGQTETGGADFSSMLMSQMMNLGSLSSQDNSLSFMNVIMPMLISVMERLNALESQSQPLAVQSAYQTAVSAPTSGLPVSGPITQDFHDGHGGIDIGVHVGTPIPTTMSGEVVYAGWNDQGYGNLVIVENGPYKTYYAHLSEVNVQVGQQVNKNTVIGLSGNTGNSTGPHLHYELRVNGENVDPTNYSSIGYSG